MIAEKLDTPYIPRLDTVKVPPDSSSGLSLFSLARPAMSLTSLAIYSRPFRLMLVKTGAISPLSVCTANDMLTLWNCLTKSTYQLLLVAGTLSAAREAAFMTKSLTDSLTVATLLSLALSFIRLSTSTWTVT